VATEFEVREIVAAEILEARWFPLEELPPGTARGTGRRIEEHIEGKGPYGGRW
jgi:hypothetical protein